MHLLLALYLRRSEAFMEEKKHKLGVSALVLVIGGLVCKCLGALFRLPLTNLLGIEGIGVFQLIMSLYSFSLVVTCGGVASSLSKLISSARARGKNEKIYMHSACLFFNYSCMYRSLCSKFYRYGSLIGPYTG